MQTRLYIYPDINTKIVHVISVGDKTDQNGDIQECRKYIRPLKQKERIGLLECLRKPKMEKIEESPIYVSEPINSEDFSDDKELIKKD